MRLKYKAPIPILSLIKQAKSPVGSHVGHISKSRIRLLSEIS